MLVLTQHLGETIRIGDDVKVTVVGIGAQQVKLGIAAPRSIAVHREEVFRRIAAERAEDEGAANRRQKNRGPAAAAITSGVPVERTNVGSRDQRTEAARSAESDDPVITVEADRD
jgi:carbon storage regulator